MVKQCSKCKEFKSHKYFSPNKSRKDGYNGWCKKCINKSKNNLYKTNPWKKTFVNIKERCNNKNCKDYPNYGASGIKCLITSEELKRLWFRDKADLLDSPSIDREHKDRSYELNNSQYIEHKINSGKDKKIPILQYDLDDNFIREWLSGTEVENQLHIYDTNISACCQGKRQSAGKFKWRYKL